MIFGNTYMDLMFWLHLNLSWSDSLAKWDLNVNLDDDKHITVCCATKFIHFFYTHSVSHFASHNTLQYTALLSSLRLSRISIVQLATRIRSAIGWGQLGWSIKPFWDNESYSIWIQISRVISKVRAMKSDQLEGPFWEDYSLPKESMSKPHAELLANTSNWSLLQ